MAKIPVIIDTDPGVDDVLAILLALSSPELDVRAIIITFGNTDVEAAHLNILRLHTALAKQFEADPESRARYVNLSSERKIILAKGADFPLEGELHSAQYFHGRDGLGGLSSRHPDLNVDSQDPAQYPWLQMTDKAGVDVALDILNAEPSRSVSYIALGPLTTLAQLMRKHGAIVSDKLGQVICMGGALDVPGNTSAVAEFNFFADPFAVKELLEHPPPSTPTFPHSRWLLIPLDITTPHELPFPLYEQHIDSTFGSTAHPSQPEGKAPLVHFASAFLERTREVMKMFGKDAMELHDIVAVWCATQNTPSVEDAGEQTRMLADGWAAVPRRFQVERLGELTRGMLVIDRREDEGAYNPGANRAAVQAELEKHKFHTSGVLESTAVPALTEVEEAPSTKPLPSGVPVVVETPGQAALLRLLCSRIWGVELP